MIVKAIEETLLKLRTEKRTCVKTLLATEESAERLIEHKVPGSTLCLTIRRILNDVTITMTAPGEKIDFVYEAPELRIDQKTVGPEGRV